MKKCPNCKMQLEDDDLFCPACGTKVEVAEPAMDTHAQEGKKCIYCGELIEDDCAFCPYCGGKVPEEQPTQSEQLEVEPQQEAVSQKDVETQQEEMTNQEKSSQEKQEAQENNPKNNTSESNPEEDEYFDEDHSSKRKYLIVGIAFTAALLGVGWWYYLSHHNTEVVVEEYADTQTVSDENNQNVSDEKVATEDIDASRPTFSQLSILYESIGENNSEQLFTQNGFQLVNTESKEGWDVYGDNIETYTMYKYTYAILYNYAGDVGTMNVECVYSPTYGDPSMTIKCDNKTWKDMKRLAESNLKDFGSNYFALDGKSLGFEDKDVITITSECSIPWGDEDIDDEEVRLLSEMAARNIEREANRQELEKEKSSNDDVSDSETAPMLRMEGYIGEYRVVMHLNISGSKAEGNYHYNNNSNSNKLYLNGDYNNGKLVLHETTDEGRPTGTFEGVLSGDEFSGEFVNYKGERFAFILQKK